MAARRQRFSKLPEVSRRGVSRNGGEPTRFHCRAERCAAVVADLWEKGEVHSRVRRKLHTLGICRSRALPVDPDAVLLHLRNQLNSAPAGISDARRTGAIGPERD
jgi:hypothetical protein